MNVEQGMSNVEVLIEKGQGWLVAERSGAPAF
jgi:hypothetical protein